MKSKPRNPGLIMTNDCSREEAMCVSHYKGAGGILESKAYTVSLIYYRHYVSFVSRDVQVSHDYWLSMTWVSCTRAGFSPCSHPVSRATGVQHFCLRDNI